jgi:hypothetical protein
MDMIISGNETALTVTMSREDFTELVILLSDAEGAAAKNDDIALIRRLHAFGMKLLTAVVERGR